MLALCVAQARADADDDYRRGLQAFHRGDVATAMATLRPPAKAGHAPSQRLLAYILDRADFTDEAFLLYTSAAAQGDAEANAGLANLYLTGRGVAKDEKKALELFSKAADLGEASAIEWLAEAHLKGSYGLGAEPRDNVRAQAAVKRAAEQGYLPAIDALSRAYRDGGLGLAPDAALAQQWQARGAELRKQRGVAAPKAKS